MGFRRLDPHALTPTSLIATVMAGAMGLTLIFALLMQCLVMIQGLLERT